MSHSPSSSSDSANPGQPVPDGHDTGGHPPSQVLPMLGPRESPESPRRKLRPRQGSVISPVSATLSETDHDDGFQGPITPVANALKKAKTSVPCQSSQVELAAAQQAHRLMLSVYYQYNPLKPLGELDCLDPSLSAADIRSHTQSVLLRINALVSPKTSLGGTTSFTSTPRHNISLTSTSDPLGLHAVPGVLNPSALGNDILSATVLHDGVSEPFLVHVGDVVHTYSPQAGVFELFLICHISVKRGTGSGFVLSGYYLYNKQDVVDLVFNNTGGDQITHVQLDAAQNKSTKATTSVHDLLKTFPGTACGLLLSGGATLIQTNSVKCRVKFHFHCMQSPSTPSAAINFFNLRKHQLPTPDHAIKYVSFPHQFVVVFVTNHLHALFCASKPPH